MSPLRFWLLLAIGIVIAAILAYGLFSPAGRDRPGQQPPHAIDQNQ